MGSVLGTYVRDVPPNPKTRIAYAERRVKPLARLLRCATALRVTAPLGCGSRRSWYDRKVPFGPSTRPDPPFPLVSSASFGSARSCPGLEGVLGTISFHAKQDSRAIQLADLFAYYSRRRVKRIEEHQTPELEPILAILPGGVYRVVKDVSG